MTRSNFLMRWANWVKTSSKWRARSNLTENNVKKSFCCFILDLQFTNWWVWFWLAQSLGSEFHLEVAWELALGGWLFSQHHGPWSLENAFIGKTCFSLDIYAAWRASGSLQNTWKIVLFWGNGPRAFQEMGSLYAHWRCIGWQSSVLNWNFVQNACILILGGFSATE